MILAVIRQRRGSSPYSSGYFHFSPYSADFIDFSPYSAAHARCDNKQTGTSEVGAILYLSSKNCKVFEK